MLTQQPRVLERLRAAPRRLVHMRERVAELKSGTKFLGEALGRVELYWKAATLLRPVQCERRNDGTAAGLQGVEQVLFVLRALAGHVRK